MYLPNLHKYILKYNTLNLFQEITLVFNHDLQITFMLNW